MTLLKANHGRVFHISESRALSRVFLTPQLCGLWRAGRPMILLSDEICDRLIVTATSLNFIRVKRNPPVRALRQQNSPDATSVSTQAIDSLRLCRCAACSGGGA
jgi:hypothetical protein